MSKKRTSPMHAKGESMEAYAGRRKREMAKKPARVTIEQARPMIMRDPEGDMHTLMRAAEVKADKKRHRDALKAARAHMDAMRSVVSEGGKE